MYLCDNGGDPRAVIEGSNANVAVRSKPSLRVILVRPRSFYLIGRLY